MSQKGREKGNYKISTVTIALGFILLMIWSFQIFVKVFFTPAYEQIDFSKLKKGQTSYEWPKTKDNNELLTIVPAPELANNGYLFGQLFVSKEDGLTGVEILITTKGNKDSGRFILSLYEITNGGKKLVRKKEVDSKKIVNNSYNRFTFKRIEDSREKKYLLTIQLSDPKSGDGYTVYLKKDNATEIVYGFYGQEIWDDMKYIRWISDRALAKLKVKGEILSLSLFCGHPDVKNSPVKVDIWIGDDLVKQVIFYENRWEDVKLFVSDRAGSEIKLKIRVDRTFVPKHFGINNDERNLGVAITNLEWEGDVSEEGLIDKAFFINGKIVKSSSLVYNLLFDQGIIFPLIVAEGERLLSYYQKVFSRWEPFNLFAILVLFSFLVCFYYSYRMINGSILGKWIEDSSLFEVSHTRKLNLLIYLFFTLWLGIVIFIRANLGYHWDTGTIYETIENTIKGNFFYSPHEHKWYGAKNHFGVHFSPILIIFLPFQLFIKSLQLYNIGGVLLLFAGAVLLYLCIFKHTESKFLALVSSISLLMNPYYFFHALQGFHDSQFFPLAWGVMVLGIFSKNIKIFILGLVLAFTTKENAPPIVFLIGFVALYYTRDKRYLYIGIVSSIAMLFITQWILKANIEGGKYMQLWMFKHFGNSTAEILETIFFKPSIVLGHIQTKINYVKAIFLIPEGFFWPFGLPFFILAMPDFLINLLSSPLGPIDYNWHFNHSLTFFLTLSSSMGINYIAQRFNRYRAVIYCAGGVLLIVSPFFKYYPLFFGPI